MMILRKPFAILIKNFKLIHMILSIFTFYLVYKTNLMLSFFREYNSSFTSVIGKDLTSELFGPLLYISIFIILLGSIVIMGLMLLKKKTIKLYIFNIVVYIIVIVIYAITYSVAGQLEIGLVDIRTLKMVQDLLTTIFMIQIVSLCILAIRATGFDIKKFNFVKDLEELEIEDVDNEEFEVNVDLDSDKWKRKINRVVRHTKYIYKENKVLILILTGIIVAISSTVIYINVGVYNKVYKENEAFSTTKFTMNLVDSYSINTDIKGNKLFEEESLVTILIDVKNNSIKEQQLEPARFILNIKDHYFYHTTEYSDKISDLGITYKNQNISSSFKKYMFVYKIPTSFLDEKMFLKYTDYTNKNIRMKVEPYNLETKQEIININTNDIINFKDSVLGNTEFNIKESSINRIMKVDYNFCITTGCYPSSEYLVPTYTGNQNKGLLYLSGTLTWDDTLPINKITDFYKFIKTFGEIRYEINGVEYTSTIPMQEVKPTKTTLKDATYIEVPSEIEYAEKIYIVLKIRNKTYIYNIK